MTTTAPRTIQLIGSVFAAQACSCTCDPCVCGDHCACKGADSYLGPRWRFVGDHVESGTAYGVNVSQRTLLNLAQTSDEDSTDWHESILIDDGATLDQVNALLATFQQQQGSEVADVNRLPAAERPVYLVPMHYTIAEERNILSVTFSQDRSRLIRGDRSKPFFKEWTYNGHVSVQRSLEQWSS